MLASRHDIPAERCRVVLIEGGQTILAGSSPNLIARAGCGPGRMSAWRCGPMRRSPRRCPRRAAQERGGRRRQRLCVGRWSESARADRRDAGWPWGTMDGSKSMRICARSIIPRSLPPEIVASVTDPETGHTLPPLAQIALEEGETVAYNLQAELYGRPLQAFGFHNKGFVVSVGDEQRGGRRGRPHHRRTVGACAQGCHRVGVSPIGQTPTRLEPAVGP